jgi:hypothetical protein
MSDNEKLLAYFMDATNERFDRLEDKIDVVLSFHWKIAGGAAAISAVITLAIQLIVSK